MASSKFGGAGGRPRNSELSQRESSFKQLLVAGHDLDDAVRESGIKPAHALKVLTPIIRSLLSKAA